MNIENITSDYTFKILKARSGFTNDEDLIIFLIALGMEIAFSNKNIFKHMKKVLKNNISDLNSITAEDTI